MPITGWNVDGVLIHPTEAYTSVSDWLRDFEAAFPNKAQRMYAFSASRGLPQGQHDRVWTQVVLHWLAPFKL